MSTSQLNELLSPADRLRLRLPSPAEHRADSRHLTLDAMREWVRLHAASLAIVLPLLAVTALVHGIGVDRGPALGDDEGTYIAQAWAVQTGHGLAHYTYWYDHPPLGWILLAGWTWLTGAFHGAGLSVLAGRHLMVLLSVLDAGLIYLLARRLGMRRTWAALALLLWALSPLVVDTSRMVLLDNLGLPWVLAAFVLACTPRTSLWSFVGAGLCFAAGVLTKETNLVLIPAFAYLAWRSTDRQTRSFCLAGLWSAFALFVLGYPLLALLKGELLSGPGHVSLVQALRFQFIERPSTGSLFSPSSGSHHTAADWVRSDAVLLVAGIAGAIPATMRRVTRPVGVALIVLVLVALKPGYLPQPYVITVLPFAALCAAGTVEWIVQCATVRLPQRRQVEVALATGVVSMTILAPTWLPADRHLSAVDATSPARSAEHWLVAHRQPGFVLVDDTLWADLVEAGYQPRNVIWFYKLDFVNNLDPSVRKIIARYQDLHTLVVSPIVRAALDDNAPGSLLIVRQAIQHSRILETFGSGAGRVEIRTVTT